MHLQQIKLYPVKYYVVDVARIYRAGLAGIFLGASVTAVLIFLFS